MTAPRRRFVVTTRSRLRGLPALPAMLMATRRIMREVEQAGRAELAASILAGPREFWTVTVWSSQHDMQEFMRSGAHGRHLWDVGDLLESFWLMRWRPTRHERGHWDGHTLAPALRPPLEQDAAAVPAAVRDHILARMPRLLAAFGPAGAPSSEHTPEARAQRALVAGAAGVLLRLPARPRRWRPARELRRLADELRAQDDDLVRVVGGRGQHRTGHFLLGVWTDERGANRLLDSDRVAMLEERWGEACWACELLPRSEFGHWDGVRLRERSGTDRTRPHQAGTS